MFVLAIAETKNGEVEVLERVIGQRSVFVLKILEELGRIVSGFPFTIGSHKKH